jgi:hypothetical protein
MNAAQIGLVLLDEVHLLNEAGRGSSLEAGCVCRIKAVAAFPEMAKAPVASVRFVAVSATIPNIGDVSCCCTHPVSGTSYGFCHMMQFCWPQHKPWCGPTAEAAPAADPPVAVQAC